MRPPLSRDAFIRRYGWREYRRYVGEQFEYQRDQVEMLLCALWNGGTVDSRWHDQELSEDSLSLTQYIDHLGEIGKKGKGKVEASARKAYVDPAESTNWPAHKIDLERGLDKINNRSRAYLELHYGWGWDQKRIATTAGVTQQSVSERIDTAVSTLTNLMNGKT